MDELCSYGVHHDDVAMDDAWNDNFGFPNDICHGSAYEALDAWNCNFDFPNDICHESVYVDEALNRHSGLFDGVCGDDALSDDVLGPIWHLMSVVGGDESDEVFCMR